MSNKPEYNFLCIQKFFQKDFKWINQNLPRVLHGYDIHQHHIKLIVCE